MAFLAEHVKKLTDDLRTTAAARTSALEVVREDVARLRAEARTLVTRARQAVAADADKQKSALAAGRVVRTAEVSVLLTGFARARAERGAADRARRAATVAGLRARAQAIREEFANDRQLAAKVWRGYRAETR